MRRGSPVIADGVWYETLRKCVEELDLVYSSAATALSKGDGKCTVRGHTIQRAKKQKKTVTSKPKKKASPAVLKIEIKEAKPETTMPKQEDSVRRPGSREPLLKVVRTSLISSEWRD